MRRADGVASIAAADIAIKPDNTVGVSVNAPTQLKLGLDLSKARAMGNWPKC